MQDIAGRRNRWWLKPAAVLDSVAADTRPMAIASFPVIFR